MPTVSKHTDRQGQRVPGRPTASATRGYTVNFVDITETHRSHPCSRLPGGHCHARTGATCSGVG